jgi:thioester reductase-like protein
VNRDLPALATPADVRLRGDMADILITGFPGFLASALLPLALHDRPGATALCLVQAHHMTEARQKLLLLDVRNPGTKERVELVAGDICTAGLGIPRDSATGISEVFHFAAVYDPSVSGAVADAVNVGGTRHVLQFCADLPSLARLHYISTCYVAGDHAGVFTETDLTLGQQFPNHYVRTKYAAEVLVREAIADGLSATIYRPGMVVGDSRTGETQKYDGPYFVIQLLLRAPAMIPMPQTAGIDSNRVGLVPRDFVVSAIAALSTMPESLGQTYALTDPDPPTVREAVETFAHIMNRSVTWVPAPTPVLTTAARLPGVNRALGIPVDAVVDYMLHETVYDTTNTTRDLASTGISCPRFADYAPTMVDFVRKHPEFGSAAMT